MKTEWEKILQDEQESLLQLSCYSIEGQLKEGIVKGTFSFHCEEERPIKGKVIVTDPRIHYEPDSFQGKSIEISYWFDGSDIKDPKSISGSFMLLTNYGEYEITYSFHRQEEKLDSSMGEIKNLFHFANLAKINWMEAKKLYFSSGFEKMLEQSAKQYLPLYQGLSKKNHEQYMEEFLQAVNKKKPIYYELQETAILLSNIHMGYREEICIHKNGWGYTSLEVRVEGSFLSVEKHRIREEDFIGNMHRLAIYIDPRNLHGGKNWGQVILKSPYETINIPVQIYQNEHHRVRQTIEKRRNAKWLNSKLTGIYLGFRSKNIGVARFKKEGEEILEALTKSDDRNPLTKLYGAHLYITQEKYHEAKWLLDRAGRMLQEEKKPIIYAYYLYLSTLITEEESYISQVREKIEYLYYTHDDVWQIAWLYMYIQKSLRQSAQKKWNFLKEIFQKGCTSPVMYLEAILLLNYQPTLLMELGDIEIRILRFGAKKKMLSEEVKGIVGYLALKEKDYRGNVCKLLEILARQNEKAEFLQAYCSQLIKGNKIGEIYVQWYEKAILSEIKLTRLYEHYMLSLNTKKEPDIPKMVLMYFSYQQDIREEYGAYIYRYVFQNRENLEDLYIAYQPKIERFLLRKLHSGKIDRDLGYLYENILYPKMITEDNARALSKLIFFHEISSDRIKGKSLVVVHKQLKEEEVYEASAGLKEVRIYHQNYQLFWEDEEGNRFVEKSEEIIGSYLKIRKMAEETAKWVADELGLALYFCEENSSWQTMNWKMEAQFKFLKQHSLIRDFVKKELEALLLDFYYENDAMERLDHSLEEIVPDRILTVDRKRLIQYFVIRDFHRQAYEFIKEYGPEEIEPKLLVRIIVFMLEQQLGEEKILSWYAYTAFQKGKYNETSLYYLVKNLRGTSKRLRDLFYAAKEFDIDTYELSERILRQILTTKAFVGNEVEIFKSYLSGGAKTNIEAAFLTYRAVGYMRDDREMELFLVKSLEKVHKRGFQLPLITHLAYLRFFAENKELMKEASQDLLSEYLEEIVVEKEMQLPFLQEYSWIEGREHLGDKTMLSYKSVPRTKVTLHYRRVGEEENFQREEFKEVYFGTYVKEFILFYGEEIQYYITETLDGQEQLTGSGTLRKEETKEGKKESRYQLINEMAIAQSLSDYSSLEQMLKEYWKKEFIIDQVFCL